MDNNVLIAQRKVKQYRDNLQSFGRELITLANKDAEVVPFNLNKAQEYIDKRISEQRKKTGKVRAIILKGRQQGASKYNCLRSIRNTMFYPNKKAFVMAHDSATTSSLFGDLKSMYNSCPPVQYIKPTLKKNNARILEFGELGSSVTVGTAGSEEVARGLTIHDLWGSEVAFWNNGDKILAALFQTVPPSKGTEIKLESTANGMGNTFYRMCMQALKGVGEYELVFVPWWWTEEYQTELDEDFALSEEECEYFNRMEKTFCGSLEDAMPYFNWRRNKIVEIGEKKFKQEYPADPHEAFQQSGECLFNVDTVNAAMESKVKEDKEVPLVMGVDAAERGDRTAICMRRGREVIRLLTWDEMDEMRLAGIVGRLINQERPAKVFFDKAYANGCVARLKELGYGNVVKAIPFSMQAIDKDIYINKRAEMHYLAKDWLDQGYLDKDEDGLSAVSIPNSVAFQTDLLSIPECDPTSSGKLKIIDKGKIKEELGMSPDLCDAFILTFAEPVMYYRHRGYSGNKLNIKTKTITQRLMEKK